MTRWSVARHSPALPTDSRLARASAALVALGGYSTCHVPFQVIIDNTSDEAATIVKVMFGDRLGLLLDTVEALRDHDLDIVRGLCETEDDKASNVFYVTGLEGGKVTDPQRIEDLRLTVINSMLQYHPESGEKLNEGPNHPKSKEPTKVRITTSDDGQCSRVRVRTPDRAGLLIDIIKTFKDVNVSGDSAEIDTEGLVADDTFLVTYHGGPLDSNMATLVQNALTYYLCGLDQLE